jgi:hypothetical protein
MGRIFNHDCPYIRVAGPCILRRTTVGYLERRPRLIPGRRRFFRRVSPLGDGRGFLVDRAEAARALTLHLPPRCI